MARRLIKGDITVDQLERLAGSASNGVLRTVNYLSETEGTTLSTALSQAVAQAVAPASTSSTALLQRRAAAAPKHTRAPAEPEAVAEEPVAAEPVEEATVAEAPVEIAEEAPTEEAAPATPAKRRTRAAAKVEEAPAEEAALAAPARRRSTRAAAKVEEAPAEEAAPATPARRRSTRAATKTEEAPAEEAAPAIPAKRRTRATAKVEEAPAEEAAPAAPAKRRIELPHDLQVLFHGLAIRQCNANSQSLLLIVDECEHDWHVRRFGNSVKAGLPVRLPFSGAFRRQREPEIIAYGKGVHHLLHGGCADSAIDRYRAHCPEHRAERPPEESMFRQEMYFYVECRLVDHQPEAVPVRGVRRRNKDCFVQVRRVAHRRPACNPQYQPGNSLQHRQSIAGAAPVCKGLFHGIESSFILARGADEVFLPDLPVDPGNRDRCLRRSF